VSKAVTLHANITGNAMLAADLAPKQLQLLRELRPSARFGILTEPAFPYSQSVIADLQAAARALGLQLIIVNARTDSDLATAPSSQGNRVK
jgi:putative ABC transport system substrate-binding protein